MSDYLTNLLMRTRNPAQVVQPRLRSVFEPSTTAAGGIAGHQSSETNNAGEAPSATEPSLQIAAMAPRLMHHSVHESVRVEGGEANSDVGERHGKRGDRGEDRNDLGRLRLLSLSPLPNEQPQVTRDPARPTLAMEPDVIKPSRSPRDSPRILATNNTQERTGRPVPAEANDQESWNRIAPKVREIVDEQLAPFQPLRTRDGDGARQAPPPSTPISTSAARAHIDDNPTLKPSLNSDRYDSHAELAASRSAVPALPAINVTIGRVDVRAVISQPQPRVATRSTQQAGTQSLDEYLKQRSGGRQ